MMKMYQKLAVLSFVLCFVLSCDVLKKNDLSVNLFPISQDKELGLQVKNEIASNPSEYPILDRKKYPEAYKHLDRIMWNILSSGKVKYRNEFAWEAYIIEDDNTLNAFCTPGGYIYVYTGLIKYLDNESDLAGVMGHEVAHADLRHSTRQLTKLYGVDILSSIALGENSGTTIAEVAKGLVSLKFSRAHESEADAESVSYLCPTEYHADGAASFFQKLLSSQQAGGTPEFMSTHPSPENRVADIKAEKATMSCKGKNSYDSRYQDFKKALP